MSLEMIQHRLTRTGVAVIYDEVPDSRWWLLRTLPAISYLGIGQCTFPTSWRQLDGGQQYQFPGYDYHVLGGIDLEEGSNLCALTNEYYESQTQYSIQPLVTEFSTGEGTLVVITENERFTPDGGQRPLSQEQFATRVGPADRIYEAFSEYYHQEGWELPLTDTKNLFVQDNASLYSLVTGEDLSNTTELFDRLPEAPYLPLYWVFCDVFARPNEYGSVPLDSDDQVPALGNWLRRRIEWDRKTAIDVAKTLNRTVSDDGSTFDPSYARRSPKLRDARTARQRLAPEESQIDARYHGWLSDIN